MQGQRGTLQFLPENFEYEYPSSSSMSTMDRQPGFWNSPMNNPNAMLSLPGQPEVSSTHRHRGGRQDGGLLGRGVQGSSSRQPPPVYSRNYHSSEAPESGRGTSSAVAYGINSTSFGDRTMETPGQSLPTYSRLVGTFEPYAETPTGSLYHHFPPEDSQGASTSGFSSSCGVLSGEGVNYRSDENNGCGSLDGRCHSSKRKSFDGPSGQSSGSSSGCPVYEGDGHMLRSSQERTLPSHSLNISESPDLHGTIRSREHFRAMVQAAQQLDIGETYSLVWPQHHYSSTVPNPVAQSLEARQSGPSTSSRQPLLPTVPVIPQVVFPIPWGGMSNPSIVGSSDFHLAPRAGTNDRELDRSNLSEYPMFVPSTELRPPMPPDPRNLSLGNGNAIIPGNVGHFSLFNPISRVMPPTAPSWMPHQAVAGQVSSSSSSLGPDIDTRTTQEQLRPFMFGRRGGVMGAPVPPRSRHSRNLMLFEQIRNALELMRREESMMIDDVMIMDDAAYYDSYRDMRLDVDNMSYEELLALEERIGNVSTGVDESAVQKNLKQRKYLSFSACKTESCCICQEDYEDGEDLGILSCGHDFHAACVGKWLVEKNVCPVCKTTALPT
ncbi:E3 ubiquitin-protein ligase MBR2-like [Wolffia australiana]